MKITTFQSSLPYYCTVYREGERKKKKRGRKDVGRGGKKEGGKEEKGSIETLQKNI